MDEFVKVRQTIADGNLEQARDLLRELIKQQPDSAEVWYLAAKAAVNQSQQRAFLEKAVEIDPLHAYAANELHDLGHPSSAPEPALVELSEHYDFEALDPAVSLPQVKDSYDFAAGETVTNTNAAPQVEADKPHYADIGQRLAAFMVDQILLMIALIPVAYFAFVQLPFGEDSLTQAVIWRARTILLTAWVLVQGFYYAYFLTRRAGQTIGKAMMKVRVVKRDGSQLSIWDAILRSVIGYPFALLPFGLGMAWVAFDKQSQGWHDMIADTIVIEA